MQLITALLIGTLFGLGLSVSEMINPARVIGFLDIGGRWDPTLMFVMAGALAVTLPGYALILSRGRPLLESRFFLPTKQAVDRQLLLGAVIFGIGWGLGGICPGPALAALAGGSPGIIIFVIAMVAGQWIAGRIAG